jgi:nicotinate dehydrogenase subunit B
MKKSKRNMFPDEGILENVNRGWNRRDFFKVLGGGILILFHPWDTLDIMALPADQRRSLPEDFNAFLHVGEDGMVTCFTGKIEMGQGVNTSLAMEMADELNVPFEKVKMDIGDTDLCPWDAGTWGSLTTRVFGPSMRAAAAEARGVLLELASGQLGVPVSQLEVKDGIVTDLKNPGKTVTYGQLTKGKKIEKYLDVKPPVEDYKKFTYVGKSFKRSDSHLKVTGQAKYTGDLKLPGMVFARILRPPSHGAKMTSVNTSAAEKIDGIQVVRDDDLIAVISENHDKVDEAIVKITAEYSFDELPVNNKNLFDYLLKSKTVPNVYRSTGDISVGREQSDIVVETEFDDTYLAHAPIETHTALAQFEGDKLTVWASTQSPFGLQDTLVREMGLEHENVRVITPFVGGGFGGKAPAQQGVEAARLAKITGKPVMVVWSREEEFFYDTFHPAGVVKVNSGMDKAGKIKMWDYNVYYAGTRGSEVIYDVPHDRATSYGNRRGEPSAHPFATGAWRAPNNNTSTFARECQINLMASRIGMDQLEFRLKNLKDEKMISCLKAVADKFGYVSAKSPSGRGIGLACGIDAGTWVAHLAEVKVDKSTGRIEVVRIACAQDMGLCVNPEGTLMQMEGCITMGLGYTFTEEVMFDGGNIHTLGFDSYEIPRFSWVPKMDCVILDRKDQAPQGGGEPAIIAIGAVVANAVHDATGTMLLRFPFTPERVLEAIRKI